jgi:hypothetical protein
MRRKVGWAALAVLLLAGPAAGIELTATERAWLEAARPVLQFAREQALPLSIVVQPQPTPGETPMGMAFVDGRCKLVLSMRGNPEAQATLDRIEPGLRGPVVEAIIAHELGHCWRHVMGHWGSLPPQAKETAVMGRISAEHAEVLRDMWQTRREEGFADLVGLAWTLKQHPERYGEVHAWHLRLRAEQPIQTGPHDTRVWVQLAQNPKRFAPTRSIFEQVESLWVAGLMAGIELPGAVPDVASAAAGAPLELE